METPRYDVFEEFQTEDVMSYNHATVAYRLTKSLSRYDDRFAILPELEFELLHGRAKPDIAVCPPGKINWLKDVLRPDAPPLIAIEILSPKQALSDLIDKSLDIYFPSGVPVVWVIIPQLRQVTVLAPGKQENVTSGTLRDEATGIELNLDTVFAE